MTAAKQAAFAADLLDAQRRWVGSIRLSESAPNDAARNVAPGTRRVNQRATVSIFAPTARQLKCEYGTVWLTDTIDGAATDVILYAGNAHRCVSASALLVYAITAAEVRVIRGSHRSAAVPRRESRPRQRICVDHVADQRGTRIRRQLKLVDLHRIHREVVMMRLVARRRAWSAPSGAAVIGGDLARACR